jgi:hypothetical protein
MVVQFGSFNSICQTAALVICPLLGSSQGIEPSCYSRNVDIAGTLIFQPCELFFPHLRAARASRPRITHRNLAFSCWPAFPLPPPESPATCFVHIVAILMTGIMIYHIRSKYTAVGKWVLPMPSGNRRQLVLTLH